MRRQLIFPGLCPKFYPAQIPLIYGSDPPEMDPKTRIRRLPFHLGKPDPGYRVAKGLKPPNQMDVSVSPVALMTNRSSLISMVDFCAPE